MIRPFEYISPTTIEEACRAIYEKPDEAKILAGGQSLIPLMKLGLVDFKFIVDLKSVRGLSFIRLEKGGDHGVLTIGTLTRYSEIERSPLVKKHVPLLSVATGGVATPLIRNRGTIGGSLCHADPSADLYVSALALGAEMVATNSDGSRRVIGCEQFFQGVFTNALGKGEILERINFPVPEPGTGFSFKKFTLGHGSFPLITVAVLLGTRDGKLREVRIAVGGASESPARMREAESMLAGSRPDSGQDFQKAADRIASEADLVSELEISADYKRRIIRVLILRALEEASRKVER